MQNSRKNDFTHWPTFLIGPYIPSTLEKTHTHRYTHSLNLTYMYSLSHSHSLTHFHLQSHTYNTYTHTTHAHTNSISLSHTFTHTHTNTHRNSHTHSHTPSYFYLLIFDNGPCLGQKSVEAASSYKIFERTFRQVFVQKILFSHFHFFADVSKIFVSNMILIQKA